MSFSANVIFDRQLSVFCSGLLKYKVSKKNAFEQSDFLWICFHEKVVDLFIVEDKPICFRAGGLFDY